MMRYKTTFRLAVRAIGLLMIAQSLPWMVETGLGLLLMASIGSSPSWMSGGYGALESLVRCAIGAYLFAGPRWIVNFAIPGNRPYCPECAYDLTGAVGSLCPECGTQIPRIGDVT